MYSKSVPGLSKIKSEISFDKRNQRINLSKWALDGGVFLLSVWGSEYSHYKPVLEYHKSNDQIDSTSVPVFGDNER